MMHEKGGSVYNHDVDPTGKLTFCFKSLTLDGLKNSYCISFKLSGTLFKVSFNNYMERKGWVVGQPNVYAYKVNDCLLFNQVVYEGWVGGQKYPKICLRSY